MICRVTAEHDAVRLYQHVLGVSYLWRHECTVWWIVQSRQDTRFVCVYQLLPGVSCSQSWQADMSVFSGDLQTHYRAQCSLSSSMLARCIVLLKLTWKLSLDDMQSYFMAQPCPFGPGAFRMSHHILFGCSMAHRTRNLVRNSWQGDTLCPFGLGKSWACFWFLFRRCIADCTFLQTTYQTLHRW